MAKFIFQIIIIKIFITSFIFSQNFSVNLHLEKRDYLYREAITILTELVNNDSEEYVMIKPIFEDGILNLIVKNEIGEILPLYETKIFSLNTRIRLKKDESVYIFFNVEPLANMGGFPICPCRSNKLLQPGSYTFQVEFYLEIVDVNGRRDKKKFISNIEKIHITEAEREVDLLAINELDQILKNYYNDKKYQHTYKMFSSVTNNLISLLSKYPNSSFQTQTYYRVYKNIFLNSLRKEHKNTNPILNNFPDVSKISMQSFLTLIMMVENEKFSELVLNNTKLKEKYKDSAIEKYFNNIINYNRNVLTRKIN